MGSIGCRPFVDGTSKCLWKITLLLGQDIANIIHHNEEVRPKLLILNKFSGRRESLRTLKVSWIHKNARKNVKDEYLAKNNNVIFDDVIKNIKLEDFVFMLNLFSWVGLYPWKVSRSYSLTASSTSYRYLQDFQFQVKNGEKEKACHWVFSMVWYNQKKPKIK